MIAGLLLAFDDWQSHPWRWNGLMALRNGTITAKLSPPQPCLSLSIHHRALEQPFQFPAPSGLMELTLPNQRLLCFLPSTCCNPAVAVTCRLERGFCGCGQIPTSEGERWRWGLVCDSFDNQEQRNVCLPDKGRLLCLRRKPADWLGAHSVFDIDVIDDWSLAHKS